MGNRDDLDVMFVVDNSCITSKECSLRQDGIAELIASIKHETKPRVAYMEYGNTANINVALNAYYNEGQGNIINDYTNYIRNIECNAVTKVSKIDVVNALNVSMRHFEFYSDGNRHKKIVFINNCMDAHVNNACNISRKLFDD